MHIVVLKGLAIHIPKAFAFIIFNICLFHV
jgi:hypothetical protein